MSPAPGGAPVSPAPGGFQSAATLFTGPKQPPRNEPPTVDPGSYPSMPSGLTGREGHEPAMRSGRPSGLPAAAAEAFPITPVTSGTRPSGLPRRVPTHAEQSAEHPAHVEFTQRLELPHAAQVRDEPAGPQPLYPAYPGAQPTQHWQSDLTQQFPAARDQPAVEQQFQQSAPTQQFAQPFDQPAARQFGAPGQDFADERSVHAPAQQFGAPQQEFTDERYAHAPAHYFERAQAGHAADGQHYDQPSFDQTTPSQHYGPAPLQDGPATHAEQAPSWDGHSAQEPVGRHGLGPAEGGRHSGAFEPVARHGYQEQPVAGQHWHQDPESFTQSAYRPAHGEQPPAYTQEPEAAHPAEWPPYPR
jgi:hypothetical protein